MATKVAVSMRLEVSEDVLRRYDEQVPADRTVEDVMAQRLASCVEHNAVRGLYFDDKQRAELEKTFGYLMHTAGEVVHLAQNMVTVKVAGVNIKLEQMVLKRAQSRAQAMRMSIEEWLEREITAGLETAVGLRG